MGTWRSDLLAGRGISLVNHPLPLESLCSSIRNIFANYLSSMLALSNLVSFEVV